MVFQYVRFSRPLVPLYWSGADLLCSSPKSFPWFVSDVTPSDFSYTIRALQTSGLWVSEHGSGEGQVGARSAERVGAPIPGADPIRTLRALCWTRYAFRYVFSSVDEYPRPRDASDGVLTLPQVQPVMLSSNFGPSLMHTTIWRKSHRSSGSTYDEVHWSASREI